MITTKLVYYSSLNKNGFRTEAFVSFLTFFVVNLYSPETINGKKQCKPSDHFQVQPEWAGSHIGPRNAVTGCSSDESDEGPLQYKTPQPNNP